MPYNKYNIKMANQKHCKNDAHYIIGNTVREQESDCRKNTGIYAPQLNRKNIDLERFNQDLRGSALETRVDG